MIKGLLPYHLGASFSAYAFAQGLRIAAPKTPSEYLRLVDDAENVFVIYKGKPKAHLKTPVALTPLIKDYLFWRKAEVVRTRKAWREYAKQEAKRH